MKPSTSSTQTSSCPGLLVSVRGTAAHLSGSNHLASLCTSLSGLACPPHATTSQAVSEEDCGPLHASATCMPRPSLGIQYSDYNESRSSLTSPDTGQAVDLLALSDLTAPVIQNKHLGPFSPLPQVQLLGSPTAPISAVGRSEGPFPYSLCRPHSGSGGLTSCDVQVGSLGLCSPAVAQHLSAEAPTGRGRSYSSLSCCLSS